MFSSLSKSFNSNINSNYSVSPNLTSTAGPWKIYDAKKKSTGKPYSVFVFDKKSLDPRSGSLGRSGSSALKAATEEVVQRLKKEASALARLRHPSVLEFVEPVEETRSGGLQFVTEPITTSLSGLLQEKDEQERAGGSDGRSSRYVTEDSDGTRRRRELEIDELEIQKGLLQVSKALEFLHENAGLVHGNLTPDAILINAKSDWKISGLAFCSPPENSNKPTSVQPINLSEALNIDTRLPRHVQLNLDYSSPDFVLDNNLTPSADMFSLGLLCIALYNSPHKSPLDTSGSVSSYKRIFNSSSSVPSASNGFLSKKTLPRDLTQYVLPRLITRRPAQRMTAKEFQDSEYFDNIMVSTIRFLDAFPTKTPNEKASFLRGLIKVLPSFPKSVMEKKLLPALLEELKDKDLYSPILQCVFKIIDLIPSAKRSFGEKVRPRIKEIFVANVKQPQEKDPARDAGLMIVLENMSLITKNSSGKDFKDDILPILVNAIESAAPSLVDVAMRGLPRILPILDFSTIKNELFPVIATVFSRTNSLAIKVRGLQAFVILCGGSNDPDTSGDGLDGFGTETKKKTSSSSALDKYTMQEKIIPLIKAIKTKEPAVMLAALNVLRVVGDYADIEFIAMDMLPILWHMSLGPLLDLKQFQSFMTLIKSLSKKVEDEQVKKLQELSTVSGSAQTATPNEDFMGFGGLTGTQFDATNGSSEDDFERLVKGKSSSTQQNNNPMDSSWEAPAAAAAPAQASAPSPPVQSPQFSWSTPSPAVSSQPAAPKPQPSFRTVTPDLNQFGALSPSTTQFSQPLQPAANSNAWASAAPSNSMSPPPPPVNSFGSMNLGQNQPSMMNSSFATGGQPSSGRSTPSGFSLPPPPGAPQQAQNSMSAFGQPSPSLGGMSTGSMNGMMSSMNSLGSMNSMQSSMNSMGPMGNNGMGMMNSMNSMNNNMGAMQPQQQSQQPAAPARSGLSKYESLL